MITQTQFLQLLAELGLQNRVGRLQVVGHIGGAFTRNRLVAEESQHACAVRDIRHLVVVVQPGCQRCAHLVDIRFKIVARVRAALVTHLVLDDQLAELPHRLQVREPGIPQPDQADLVERPVHTPGQR